MCRAIIIAALAILALCLAITLLVLSPRANAAGMMGVGVLMDPRGDAPAGSGAAILTEAGSTLTTETGSPLRTE